LSKDPRLEDTARLAELGLISATLAHELRQPLFATRALAQLLQVKVQDPGQAALVRDLLQQTQLMESLVEGIGMASRRAGADLMALDLGASVRQVVELMEHRAKRRSVRLDLQCHEGLGATRAEPTAVVQIVMNLVANALDASPSGGVVEVRVALRDQRHWVFIEDQGPGISETLADRIFEPFFSTKPAGQGTGLGLAVARVLAERSGARLELLRARPGARFGLELSPWVDGSDAGD
jgi:signal transduction histidine kinase